MRESLSSITFPLHSPMNFLLLCRVNRRLQRAITLIIFTTKSTDRRLFIHICLFFPLVMTLSKISPSHHAVLSTSSSPLSFCHLNILKLVQLKSNPFPISYSLPESALFHSSTSEADFLNKLCRMTTFILQSTKM